MLIIFHNAIEPIELGTNPSRASSRAALSHEKDDPQSKKTDRVSKLCSTRISPSPNRPDSIRLRSDFRGVILEDF